MFAHRLSKFLSRVALVSVVLAFGIAYYDYPPIGIEGRIFISSVAVVLALGAGLLTLVLAGLLLVRRQRPRPWNAVVVACLSVILALVFVWLL